MRQIKTMTLGMMLGVSLAAHADGGQVVTVNGQTVANAVEQITFNGDMLTLLYADGTEETADMEQVTIVFTLANALKTLDAKPGDVQLTYFDLTGRQLRKAPAKGACIMKKGSRIVKLLRK